MKSRLASLLVVLAAAIGAAAAVTCGGDDGGRPDTSGDVGGDGDGPSGCTSIADCPTGYCGDGSPRACQELPALTADMSCLHDNLPDPPGTGTVTANVFVEDFADDYRVEGATIDLFFDNVVDDTPDATVGPTDSNGEVGSVPGVPNSNLIAYRVHGGELSTGEVVKTTIEYDVETPDADGQDVRLLSISDTTYRLIPTILGIRPTSDHGVIAGAFEDCTLTPDGDPDPVPVEGIVARMLDASGRDCHDLDAHECYSRYFVEEYPSRLENQPYSSPDGLYAIAEVPPGPWTVEILGRLTASGAAEVIGRKLVQATADAIVIVDVNPLAE